MKYVWNNISSWAPTILDHSIPLDPCDYFTNEMIQAYLISGVCELEYQRDLVKNYLEFHDKKNDIRVRYIVGQHLITNVAGLSASRHFPMYDTIRITMKKMMYCFCSNNPHEDARLQNLLSWFLHDHPMSSMAAHHVEGRVIPFFVYEVVSTRTPLSSPLTMHLFCTISLGTCFPCYQNQDYIKNGGTVTMGSCQFPYCKACRNGAPLMKPKFDSWIEHVDHPVAIGIGIPPRLTAISKRTSASVDEILTTYFKEDTITPMTPPSKKKKKKKADKHAPPPTPTSMPKSDSIDDLLKEVFSISMDDL